MNCPCALDSSSHESWKEPFWNKNGPTKMGTSELSLGAYGVLFLLVHSLFNVYILTLTPIFYFFFWRPGPDPWPPSSWTKNKEFVRGQHSFTHIGLCSFWIQSRYSFSISSLLDIIQIRSTITTTTINKKIQKILFKKENSKL